MKKRNIFVCFIFTLLMCFSLCFSAGMKTAFADGESTQITITFKAVGGTTDAEPITMQAGEAIGTLPTAQKNDYIFRGWHDGTDMVTESTTFSVDTELSAIYVKKIYEYSIIPNSDNLSVSENSEGLTIEAKTAESTFNYTLSENCLSVQDALNLIANDIDTKSSQTTITLNNLEITQNLNISIQNVIFTGSLNLNEYSILYTAPVAGSSSLGLSDLVLNSSSSQNFVEILGANSSNVNLSNVQFNSSSKNNNYAILLEKPVHKLKFENNLSYSSEYLYNFEKTTRHADFTLSFSLTSPAKVVITIPYYADEMSILQTYLTSESFEFVANQTNFSCSVQESTSTGRKNIFASTNFNFVFDENNATVSEAFTNTSSKFNLISQLNFPTETNYQKEHFYLDGFVAKFNDGSTDWYFDATALTAYLNDNTNPSFEKHFYSSVPAPDSNAVGFTYFKYNSSSEINFLATDFMLGLNKTPTFVTLWKNISYSITFIENDGTEVSDASGIFNSGVTLPSTSKTGYDFVGWFTSPELAEEANPANIVNITMMPDTNPSYYAGWKIRSHTLSIHKNNQNPTVQTLVDFGTQISTLEALDSTLITRTGYSFAGWFTDELFENALDENQTMPDGSFEVFAKWTINEYTITLYLNHRTDSSVYKTATRKYNTDVRDLFNETPSFVGETFTGWFTDEHGQYPFTSFPEMMPAENLTLYAGWLQEQYSLTIHYPALNDYETINNMHYGDDLPLLHPVESGFNFEGWYADEDFTEELSVTTMPNSNFEIFAKFSEKRTITLTLEPQSYTISENEGFVLNSDIEDFEIEYLVNGEWTATHPTLKGSYDIRISRAEDGVYKTFVKTFKDALVITADEINVSIYSLILYCIAVLELICSIIVLFIRKQRKTYLTYAITLPMGIIPTTQFVNLIISLTLAVFGLVLLSSQLVKLKKVNNEIAKISTENKEYTPPDVSEDKSISKKVEILLKQQGFISSDETDENEELDKLDELDEKPMFDENNENFDNVNDDMNDGERFTKLEELDDDLLSSDEDENKNKFE